MTTACTATKPIIYPQHHLNTNDPINSSPLRIHTIGLDCRHHHHHHHHHDDDDYTKGGGGEEEEDEDDDDDEQGSESQLFSPPPRSWFVDDGPVTATASADDVKPPNGALLDNHRNSYNNSSSYNGNNNKKNSNISSPVVVPAAATPRPTPLPQPNPSPTLAPASFPSIIATNNINHLHHHHHHHDLISTASPFRHHHQHPRIAAPQQAPSWQEVSCRVLPAAAKELISTCLRRMVDTAHRGYVQTKWTRKYSDLGNNAVGYYHHHHVEDHHPINNNSDGGGTLFSLSSLELPPFSSLPWIDRQLVAEWRTFDFSTSATIVASSSSPLLPPPPFNAIVAKSTTTLVVQQEDDDIDDDDMDDDLHSFDKARTLVPKPLPRPTWQCAEYCFVCSKPFGPTRLRHHCRLCGNSYCQYHASARHALPHLGYDPDIPERVCDPCKAHLLHLNHVERVAWRLARCRDLELGTLTPYFETGVDTLEQAAWRVAKATLTMVKSFPLVTCVLGTSATVAVETLDVLRQYGLQGIYGILLRREFLAAADLLRRALGINRTSWPLSVHELTAAIFYALAQHRAMRGLHPDQEHVLHSYRHEKKQRTSSSGYHHPRDISDNDIDDDEGLLRNSPPYHHHHHDYPNGKQLPLSSLPTSTKNRDASSSSFTPVCDPVSDALLGSLLWYAPLALKFIYAAREVEIQLLAAQQGWRLLYAHLEPEQLSNYDGDGTPTAATATPVAPPPTDDGSNGGVFWEAKLVSDRPATAMLVHQQAKIACLVIRGTTTIQDVVTDIRQTPIPFPTEAPAPTVHHNTFNDVGIHRKEQSFDEEDWTSIFRGQGLAVCGMANAAMNLFRDHVDVFTFWAQKGYRIRITGHSLGGGVAALLGVLLLRHFEELQLVPTTPSTNNNTNMELGGDQDLLRVYAYGTPSCVDGVLSDKVKPFVTTVVLHDDVVPRMTPTSIRGLLKHLLFIRETWVKAHLPDDIFAITERAKTAWAPRWRGSFTLRGSTPSSIQRYCRKQIRKGTKKLFSVKGKLAVAMANSGRQHHKHPSQHVPNDDLETISETSSGVQMRHGFHTHDKQCTASLDGDSLVVPAEESGQDDTSEPAPRLLLDYMGGIDSRTQGIVIDGDEFFDTERSLILEEDEESSEVEEENQWSVR
jgi:hypothetical protein